MARKLVALVVLLLVAVGAVFFVLRERGPSGIVLTGVVTTDDVIVSSQVTGQISKMTVAEGDSVRKGELVAEISPAELRADQTYYVHSAQALAARVSAARASLDAAMAQDSVAMANAVHARRSYQRDSTVAATGVISAQALDASRTAYTVAQARAQAAHREVAAARGSLAAAEQQRDAARAQASGADVRLGYTEVRAPMDGIVDVRAAHAGEVVPAGQPIVTLINPDSVWVRTDVEESYVDRIRLGDTLTVRLPSGATLPGVVYYRGVDAEFATQRDVSRTKRDLKTFEIRLRVDNSDRRLAVGMTAQVILPPSGS